MIQNLPDDLFAEILSWVPVDSLIRMKCVHKYWYQLLSCLISSKPFVSKHVKNCNRASDSTSLFLKSYSIGSWRSVSFRDKDMLLRFPTLEVGCDRLETLVEWFDTMFDGHGCYCNGIVGTYYWGSTVMVVLRNPALGISKVIEGSCLAENGRFHRLEKVRVYLGHDPIHDVYKLIRFVFCKFQRGFRAEMNTLGVDGDGSWRELQFGDLEINSSSVDQRAVSCDGHYYWSIRRRMFSLDMHSEKFRNIPTPFESEDDRVWTMLALLNNGYQVSVIRYRMMGDVNVWVMHGGKDGKNYSWTNLMRFSVLGHVVMPVLFWNNDEELLFFCRKLELLFSYNLRSQKVRCLEGLIKQMGIYPGVVPFVFPYVPSLLSF